MILYHVDVYLPPTFLAPTSIVRPTYSQHAKRAARNDRYGNMVLPRTINLAECQVIEIGIENEQVQKILFRSPYNDTLDMCIVFIPGSWFVKTVWFNERDDAHRTLDKSKYASA